MRITRSIDPAAYKRAQKLSNEEAVRYFDNSIMNHAQLIYCDVDLIPIACKGSYLIVCHERHINMQTRLSNMQHDLFGLYQEHNDGPWLCSPYVEIPDDIPSEQKRVVIATLWI